MDTPNPSLPIYVVTTMARAHWDSHGRAMIASTAKHWPAGTTILCYVDGGLDYVEPIETPEGTSLMVDMTESIPGLSLFLAGANAFPLLRGEMHGAYDYRLDARFGRKAFVQDHAAERIVGWHRDLGARMFWLDADTLTHAPVTVDFLEGVLPDDKAVCYLGRKQIGMHSECGFVGWNLAVPGVREMVSIFRSLFANGTFLLFPEFHDCVAFDTLVASVIEDENWQHMTQESFVDLGEGVPLDKQHIHVFVNSVLGSVMDHLKGPTRKELGLSPAADLTAPRQEPYWTGAGAA